MSKIKEDNNRLRLSDAKESRERALKTLEKAKEANKDRTVPVKIDARTTIFIRPGEDPEKARIRFVEGLRKSGSEYGKTL